MDSQAIIRYKTRSQQVLGGAYGDIFWNLMPSTIYVAGTELPCIVYVANPTDEDREYMLSLSILRDGAVVTEYPVRVDVLVWFPVEANSVISLPGALVVGYSDVGLVMSLYEKEQNGVVDTVSVALTTAGTSGLPSLPEFPGMPPSDGAGGISLNSMMSLMITMMMIVMMMKMLSRMTE